MFFDLRGSQLKKQSIRVRKLLSGQEGGLPTQLLALIAGTEDMSRHRFNFSEGFQLVIMALVFAILAGLSIVLIIALLSDWPKMLHG